MFITDYGPFDGDKWEAFCQICFKLKYECEGYQEMPASPGDYGIEGFTRTGKVFQCYCPDYNYPSQELYDAQRDKITKDIEKLRLYEQHLKKYLHNVKIKQWIFVTPQYRKHELIKHCVEKAEEYRKKKISILDSNFDVLVHDIGFYSSQINTAFNYTKEKINIGHKIIELTEIKTWQESENNLVKNAIKKHRLRLPDNLPNIDNTVQNLTQRSIKHFLLGNEILMKWEISFQRYYEKFLKIVSQYEEKIEEMCLIPTDDNNRRYEEIRKGLLERLMQEFPDHEQTMLDDLVNQVIADWILRCPLNFE